MAQQEATVEVNPDTVASIVPETLSEGAERSAEGAVSTSTADSIPIDISAFDDKLYLTVPDFGRIERKAQRHVSSDTVLHGDGPEYPVDRSEIDTIDEALQLEFDRRGLSTDYVPEPSDQYCMHLDSICRCFLKVYDANRSRNNPDVTVEPQDRNLITDPDAVYDQGSVSTHQYGDVSAYDRRLFLLIEAFGHTVGNVAESEYWQGYLDGQSNAGERIGWDEIAWTKFDREYDGDAEMLCEIGTYLAETGQVVCNRTNALFPIGEWSCPTGSYVNTISDVFDGTCPECGADKDDNWECISSSNRTRVPNKYKCTECGATRNGITTG